MRTGKGHQQKRLHRKRLPEVPCYQEVLALFLGTVKASFLCFAPFVLAYPGGLRRLRRLDVAVTLDSFTS